MSNKNTATLRTTWNAAVLAFAVWIAERVAGIDIDVSNPTFIAGVAVVAGIGYRASIEISDRLASHPTIARILFGTPKPPTYD